MNAPFSQSITVKPGPASLIGTINADTLIMNNDPINAVWLGPSTNTFPGNGIRVGPLGSVTWTNDGPVSACVDTGVLTLVTLQVSNSAISPVSPVDVATATAQQLFAGGIPVVARTVNLFHGVNLPLNTNTGQLTCAGYSSLYLRLSPGLYNTVVQQLIIDWRDTPGGPIVASDEIDTTGTGNIQNFTMPCKADYVTVTSICTAAPLFSLDVIASTRPTDRIRSSYTYSANTQLATTTSIFVGSGGAQVISLALPVEGPTSWTVFCPTLTGSSAVLNVSVIASGGVTQFQQYLTSGQSVRFIAYSPMMAQYLQLATSSTANITVTATAARVPV